MRGRKPTPTRLREARGNPRRTPYPADEAKPEAALPTCPDHLDELAKAKWGRISVELLGLGLLTGIDRAALAAYCWSWARWVEAAEKIKAEGPVLTGKRRTTYHNPWLSVAYRSMEQMHKFLAEFGMSPSSRTRAAAAKASDRNKPKTKFFD